MVTIMKYSIWVGLVCFVFIGKPSAQVLNQDAEGESTIVWEGTTGGIGIADGLIKFNHYFKPMGNEETIWGIDVQGKNKSGAADFFKSSKFTPNAKGSILFGRQWVEYSLSDTLDKYIVYKGELQEKIEIYYEKTLVDNIKGCSEDKIYTDNIKEKLKDYKYNPEAIMPTIDNVYKIVKGDNKCEELIDEIGEIQKKMKESAGLKRLISMQLRLDTIEEYSDVQYSKTLIYARIGVETLEFKLDQGKAFSTIDTRFPDTLQVGVFGKIGFTGQFQKTMLGLSLGLARTNNFSSLEKEEYKFAIADTSITQGTLQQTEAITAYVGDYKKYFEYQFDFDLIRVFPIQDNQYYAIGPYLRINFPIGEDDIDEKVVLGLNASLLNGKSGKFQGSLFIQTDDLAGSDEKVFSKTLRIGLVTKFSLGALFIKQVDEEYTF